jgi:hypothetical protein
MEPTMSSSLERKISKGKDNFSSWGAQVGREWRGLGFVASFRDGGLTMVDILNTTTNS